MGLWDISLFFEQGKKSPRVSIEIGVLFTSFQVFATTSSKF